MNPPIPEPDDPQPIEPEPIYPETPISPETEAHLSGAYRRILRIAVFLSVAATVVVTLVNWRAGLGAAIGSLVGLINFVWLHQTTEKLVDRMLAASKSAPPPEENTPAKSSPSRFRFMFPFPPRYLLIIAVAYVILKSYPRLLIGFMVGLVLPLLASFGEGIYEAVTIGKTDQTSD
jgi:ATP synthase I chain